MKAPETSADAWPDLVDRLAAHGITYLMGGSSWEGQESRHAGPEDVPLAALILDLARAAEPRLRHALIALLLRHPEHSSVAEATARELQRDDPARQSLLLSILVAAALQAEWSFTFDLYLPHRTRIMADHLARELGLPAPAADYGRPCLAAAAALLREEAPFPFNYEADWEDSARRLRAQLIGEARQSGA